MAVGRKRNNPTKISLKMPLKAAKHFTCFVVGRLLPPTSVLGHRILDLGYSPTAQTKVCYF